MKNLFYTLFLISIILSCTNKGDEKKAVAAFINDAVNKARTANKLFLRYQLKRIWKNSNRCNFYAD